MRRIRISRRSRKRTRKRTRKRKFGSSSQDFISEFKKNNPDFKIAERVLTIQKYFNDISKSLGIKTKTPIEDKEEYKYFKPIIDSFIMNMIIHPETLDWVMENYYPNQNKPEFYIPNTYSIPPYNKDSSSKFRDNTSMLDKFEINCIITIMNLLGPKFDKDKLPIFHACLVNYFIYPDTLKYIMLTKYPDREIPTIFKHELYKHYSKILLATLLFTGISTSIIYRKKIKREMSPLVNYVVHQLSPERKSPKRRRSRN